MKNPYINEVKQETKTEIQTNQNLAQNGGILSPFLPNSNSGNFIKGALIGAAATFILTNENAQQAIFKAVVKMGKLLQAGSEEIKERFEDAKAEIESGE